MVIFIIERTNITPLLSCDWMTKMKLIIGRMQLNKNNQSENEKVLGKFLDLFEKNRTIKDVEIIIQLERGHYPVKQKPRPIPLHLQEDVETEIQKPIKAGHEKRK